MQGAKTSIDHRIPGRFALKGRKRRGRKCFFTPKSTKGGTAERKPMAGLCGLIKEIARVSNTLKKGGKAKKKRRNKKFMES